MKMAYLAYFLLLSGITLIILAVMRGEASIALFLIFPVIYGSGFLSMIGVLLIMLSIFLLFLSPFYELKAHAEPVRYKEHEPMLEPHKEVKEKTKIGGVIMLGPIPIVFGSDKSTALLSVLITILMLVSIAIIFFLYG